ncbi:MAG: GNAT family N-acetyltransferase [Bacteroidetes bacterium]|nr:GNAT family N-acetyltransferase [Bacteroidota bacterium]
MKPVFVTRKFEDLSTTELYRLLQLRQEVFVVEQNCPYLDADGKDFSSLHVMGFVDEELVAYCRLVQPGISYNEVSIGRVISATKHRGKQLGKALMVYALQEIRKIYGPVPVRIGAQAYLKGFYESFGFQDLNEPYLEDGIPHLIMLKPAG